MSGVPVSTLSRGHRRMDPAGSLCPRRLTTYSKSQMLSPYIIRHAYGLGEGLISCLEMRKLLKWFGTLERLLGVLILFQNKHNSCWVCKFVKKTSDPTSHEHTYLYGTTFTMDLWHFYANTTVRFPLHLNKTTFPKKSLWSVNSASLHFSTGFSCVSPFPFSIFFYHLNICLPNCDFYSSKF